MRIAIAGASDVGTYFVEEFSQSNHDVVLLNRREKKQLRHLKVEQRVTDYTVSDLTSKLEDCDALVSTTSAPGDV
ncbi:hypothetical protein LTR47_012059, partial [Exophiala xenobiotica]